MAKPITCRLFVYGSLRRGFQHPAYQYISEYFNFVAQGKVRGLLYDLGDYPAAVPTESDRFIFGELYELKNEDEFGWAMAQLDDYEGVQAEPGESAMYRRNVASIVTGNEEVNAWIYWYNRSIDKHPLIPSGDVLQYMQEKNNQ